MDWIRQPEWHPTGRFINGQTWMDWKNSTDSDLTLLEQTTNSTDLNGTRAMEITWCGINSDTGHNYVHCTDSSNLGAGANLKFRSEQMDHESESEPTRISGGRETDNRV